jgi:hypothetical protein
MRPDVRRRLAVLFLLAGAAPAPLLAFPGSVRWGYGNCVTCHYNVAGGGVLTPYGRQLSRELLSTWGGEREAEFAYGTSKLPAWLALGGDIAYLAASGKTGDTVRLLQADLELAATRGRLLAVATAGRDTNASGMAGSGWLSRRHYVQVAATPSLSFRAGRFLPNYGVWNGDPMVATQRGLGWDRDTYNVEANWITERFNVAAAGILASADDAPAERGVSASGGVFFHNKYKVWLSALSRSGPGQRRRAVGVSTVLGIGKRAYLLAQTDLEELRRDRGPLTAPSSKEIHANVCFARETVKGLYVLLIDEMSRSDVGSPGRLRHSYGTALRWFPRPHLEVQLRWRKQAPGATSPEYLDGVSAFVHFYP